MVVAPDPIQPDAADRRRGGQTGRVSWLWVEDLGLQGFGCCCPGRIADYESGWITTPGPASFALASRRRDRIPLPRKPSAAGGRCCLQANRDGLGGSPGSMGAFRAAWWTRFSPWPNICVPCGAAAAKRYASILRPVPRRWPRDKFAPPLPAPR